MRFVVRTYSGYTGREKCCSFDTVEWALSWARAEARHLEQTGSPGRILVLDDTTGAVLSVCGVQRAGGDTAAGTWDSEARQPRILASALHDYFTRLITRIETSAEDPSVPR